MTVQELHEALAELIENGHGEKELRFVYQPSYPLQDEVRGLCVPADLQDEKTIRLVMEENEVTRERAIEIISDEGDGSWGKEALDLVYLVSGGQDYEHPYGPRAAFDNVM